MKSMEMKENKVLAHIASTQKKKKKSSNIFVLFPVALQPGWCPGPVAGVLLPPGGETKPVHSHSHLPFPHRTRPQCLLTPPPSPNPVPSQAHLIQNFKLLLRSEAQVEGWGSRIPAAPTVHSTASYRWW